jgi:branched-chain amino acid transport system permease protein
MSADEILNFGLGVATGVATLVIVALGLAVIFGMMGVINFAHGEFLMLGAFGTLTGVRAGLPLPVAMVVASLAVGGLGVVVERLLIQRLYGRLEATMLATFGLSLMLVQGAVLIWGTSTEGLKTPLGQVDIGRYSISEYRLVLIAAAIGLLTLVWFVFTRTRVGIMARAATQKPEMAAALGVNANRVNMWTFGFGCALAGAGGALLAPMVAIAASMGAVYIARAFMTVVVGGSGLITGTAASSGLLGTIERVVSDATAPLTGTAALLFTAIIIIRILPTGISGRWGKRL